MSYTVHIEPADDQRRAFARWALSQTPKLQTSSSTGTDVPVDLYPDVPPELLEGAFVDGFRYGGPEAPQAAPVAPPKDEVTPKAAGGAGGPQTGGSSGPEGKPRKRTARRPRKAAESRPTTETIADTGTPQDDAGPSSSNSVSE